LHQIGDLSELNVKLRCQKVKTSNAKIVCVWNLSITDPMPANIIKLFHNSFLNTNQNIPRRWKIMQTVSMKMEQASV